MNEGRALHEAGLLRVLLPEVQEALALPNDDAARLAGAAVLAVGALAELAPEEKPTGLVRG